MHIEAPAGRLIINADDWGRDIRTTDRTLDCVLRGTVSSVSAMVFMADSERAANLARERNIDAGLHLNLTTALQPEGLSSTLVEHHQRISRYLLRYRYAPIVFQPALARSFQYVVAAQLDEFIRLYGRLPNRIDGHHHMHLCSNILLSGLLPNGTIVRRNFTFQPGEKSALNRLYRKAVDHILARRHYITDYFFSLPSLIAQSRFKHLLVLAQEHVVEVETHPDVIEEYRFLASDEIFQRIAADRIAPSFSDLNNPQCATNVTLSGQ